MTPTPNPTAEPLKSWEVDNEAWEAFSAEEHLTNGIQAAYEAGLRAQSRLSEGTPSEEQVERAAKAYLNGGIYTLESDGEHHARMRAALTAAGVAPQEPLQRPVKYDDDFIDRGARALHETQNPWIVAHGSWAAAGHEIQQAFRESARAALTSAGVAPQPLALDPEKVAEVVNRHEPIFKDGRYAGRCICGFEHPSYSGWRLHRSGALCEAAKRGELSA